MKLLPRSMWFVLGALGVVGAVALSTIDQGQAQQSVVTTPSKKTLEDASADNCETVSSVVQRCAQNPVAAPPAKKSDDELERSRAATKAAFDRRDRQGQADALKGTPTGNTPVGDAQQLGGVTVTGKSGEPTKSVEDTLQKALEQPAASPNGITSKYAPNGSRYDCIEKCVGPFCCTEVRQLPNPARDTNSIGR
jgi:hypothetical protein